LKPKETLWRIAKRYGVTIEILMEINHIDNYSKLGVGQKIILPVSIDKIVDNRF
jgi:LysM repeat protein